MSDRLIALAVGLACAAVGWLTAEWLAGWYIRLRCWILGHDWVDAECVGRGIICWRCNLPEERG